MITITSYLHRDVLKDLIRRWINNQAHSSDGQVITRLIHFNHAYVSRYLSAFAETIFQNLYGTAVQSRRARSKGDLKDAIVKNVQKLNPRIEDMLMRYRELPEHFYRETPFQGTLYFRNLSDQPIYIGSSRIKRVKRLAEKSARRIIDWMFSIIKKRADSLAEERARQLAIPSEKLITPPEDMLAEFLKAESRLLEDLKHRHPIDTNSDLVIQDVAGVKLILEDEEQQPFLERIGNMERCNIVEIERHAGHYNAVNLIVQFKPDREQIIGRPLADRHLQIMASRGLNPQDINMQFQEFVRSGEQWVQLEIIVCNYQEMLESEIGRCMHEDRIIRQRQEQPYNGQLASNIEYLMEYLFAFPASSHWELGELPIKLWYRYLPDYFSSVLQDLFGIPSLEVLD